MRDIARVVRKECKTLEDLRYMVSVIRTRPYSRLAAIIDSPYYSTLKDYCQGVGEHELSHTSRM